jgi:hypothetical protein
MDLFECERGFFENKIFALISCFRRHLLDLGVYLFEIERMKLLEVAVFFFSLHFAVATLAFVSPSSGNKIQLSVAMSADGNIYEAPCTGAHPFSSLPGDPSLHIVTNVNLGDKKLDIMKGKAEGVY